MKEQNKGDPLIIRRLDLLGWSWGPLINISEHLQRKVFGMIAVGCRQMNEQRIAAKTRIDSYAVFFEVFA